MPMLLCTMPMLMHPTQASLVQNDPEHPKRMSEK